MTGEAARKLRILIVDDEVLTLKALARILKSHEVTLASSGAIALKSYEERGPFDVILCDVMMPEMTGPDVYRELQVRHPGSERRIVFISGGAFGMDILEFLDQVDNRMVAKPFDRDDLLDVVRAIAAQESGRG